MEITFLNRSRGVLYTSVFAFSTVLLLILLVSTLYLHWRARNVVVRATLHVAGQSDFKTLSVIVKSPLVLNAALEQPIIHDLAIIQNQPQPQEWLTRSLAVQTNPQTRELYLQLRAGDSADIEEARLLLRTIVDIYRERLATMTREPILVRMIE